MAGRTTVGLDIGTWGVRAAEVSVAKGQATLERFGQVALPPGAVRGGEIADQEAVVAAIRQLWDQTKFGSKRVCVGVANQKVVVRQVDLPWLPADDMRKSLPFQAQDFIPMPVEEAIVDYHPLEEFASDDGGRMLRLLLVAAGREMVQRTVDTVQRAGLNATTVDLTSFAVLRTLAPLDETGLGSGYAEALVDVGASVTNIVVHQAGQPRFVRILLMGGRDLTDAVADRLGVPPEQAESVKQQLGIPLQPGAPADGHPAARVIEHAAAALIEEIRSSLDYYLASPHAVPVGRMVVSGGGSLLPGLTDRLCAATRLPVQAAAPLDAVRVGKTGLTPEQLSYVQPMATVPVGLALGAAS